MKDLPFKMPQINLPQFPDTIFNIVDYGAVGDGNVLNTDAIINTIEACSKAGGGTVNVPPGLWLTGPIKLQSNINLHLQKGAFVVFTSDHTHYPIIKAPKRGFIVTPPIYGYDHENVAITGEGIMDGSGDSWRPVKKFKVTESQWKNLVKSGGVVDKATNIWWPSIDAMTGEQYLNNLRTTKKKADLTADDYLPARIYLRPYMVLLIGCKKVLFDGPTIQNSPKFALMPNWCEDVVIRNVKINNEWWAQNGDGIDINSCKNVLIYNCTVTAGDDAICMKSNKHSNEPSLQNVVIADCIVYHGHGGFVIGSDIDGGMRNISVTNCNFIGTDIGLRFKSARDRGGLVENVYIKNIYMKNIVNEAILFDTFYEDDSKDESEVYPVTATTPRFEKFAFDSIFCMGAKQAIMVHGLPEMPIREIEFTNVFISADKGFESKYAAQFNLNQVKIVPHEGPIYSFGQSSDLSIQNGFCPEGTPVFMMVDGRETCNIRIMDTDLSPAQNPIEYGKDVGKDVVIWK